MLLSLGWIIVMDWPFQTIAAHTVRCCYYEQNQKIWTYHQSSGLYRPVFWLCLGFIFKFYWLIKYLNSLGLQYIADMLTEYKPIPEFIRITFLDVSEETW